MPHHHVSISGMMPRSQSNCYESKTLSLASSTVDDVEIFLQRMPSKGLKVQHILTVQSACDPQ